MCNYEFQLSKVTSVVLLFVKKAPTFSSPKVKINDTKIRVRTTLKDFGKTVPN